MTTAKPLSTMVCNIIPNVADIIERVRSSEDLHHPETPLTATYHPQPAHPSRRNRTVDDAVHPKRRSRSVGRNHAGYVRPRQEVDPE